MFYVYFTEKSQCDFITSIKCFIYFFNIESAVGSNDIEWKVLGIGSIVFNLGLKNNHILKQLVLKQCKTMKTCKNRK